MEDMDPRQQLEYIRSTMAASTRYTNVPPEAHLAAGLVGVIAALASFYALGIEKTVFPAEISENDVFRLALVWGTALVLGSALALFLLARRARKLGVSAWKSPAAMMFSSQVPQFMVAGTLTLALHYHGAVALVPGAWLLCYGLILFGFHYYTGNDHLRQSFWFMLFGAMACFSPLWFSIILLAAGFGGVNLYFGLPRRGREKG